MTSAELRARARLYYLIADQFDALGLNGARTIANELDLQAKVQEVVERIQSAPDNEKRAFELGMELSKTAALHRLMAA
ncbi:hypothetical protein [Hydrocarboniphaga effusa]|uniref:hypothetical protein n=1 Tax=Hydrocarboniphaga effusa TaxID=243629 RepID=UPI003BA890F6